MARRSASSASPLTAKMHPFTPREPSEERLKHELENHAVLHLATHGFFQPEGTPSMWESALNERGKRPMRARDAKR